MRKKISIVLVLLLSLLVTSCASYENQKQSKGSFWVSQNGDYVVINSSGGVIQDVWKLKDVLVQSPDGSDGWYFMDNKGNSVSIGGDSKVIRVYDNETMDKYNEYHYEFETQTYQELYPTENK